MKAALLAFASSYDEADDNSAWFDTMKDLAEKVGFAREVKEYKAASIATPIYMILEVIFEMMIPLLKKKSN